MTTRTDRAGYWPGVLIATLAIVLLGIVVAPERTWPNVLLAATYFVGLGLAGMLFLAFHYLTTAGWSVCLKRIAEALASTLPIAAVLILFSLGGIGVLYEWSHAEVVAHDPILQGKAGWLNAPFFIGRTVLYLAVWLFFYRAMIRISRKQDATGGLQPNRKSTVLSAAFMAAFIVTFSLASFDWLMSLQPHWFSTIFAAYNFAGSFVSGLAVITIAAILLRRRGPLAGIVNDHHLHDLGKLILGFSIAAAYCEAERQHAAAGLRSLAGRPLAGPLPDDSTGVRATGPRVRDLGTRTGRRGRGAVRRVLPARTRRRRSRAEGRSVPGREPPAPHLGGWRQETKSWKFATKRPASTSSI